MNTYQPQLIEDKATDVTNVTGEYGRSGNLKGSRTKIVKVDTRNGLIVFHPRSNYRQIPGTMIIFNASEVTPERYNQLMNSGQSAFYNLPRNL